MDQQLVWGFGLFGLAALIVVLELFIPSGGLLALAAGAMAIAAVVMFFYVNIWWGIISAAFVIILTPALIYLGLKIWPNTPIGRLMILGEDEEEVERLAFEAHAEQERRDEQTQALLDATGIARTDLRPIGVIDIEGQRVEAMAEGGMILAGAAVRITKVHAGRITVREIDPKIGPQIDTDPTNQA